jgi:glycosyltransferase involved in cell wall biosynthesis
VWCAATLRRHLCIVTETYPPEINGVALTLARLVDGLRTRGHEVSIVRPRHNTVAGADREPDAGATLVRGLPIPGYRGVQVGCPAAGLLLDGWTRRRPDVVYVATPGPLGWSAIRAARRLSVPVLSGFHTNFHTYAPHYGAGWSQRLIVRYLRAFHNQTLGTLVPTDGLRDQLQALGFSNLRVLGRGVDRRLFTPARRCAGVRRAWGVSGDGLVALYVGRIAPEKNLELAVAAFRAMQRAGGVSRFVVVGDGPLRAALQAAHPDLLCCGVLTGERLATHYASADIFLFPSETETFGNVTLEAMASGLAVVAYDRAAARLHIAHGETGILVPPGAPGAFVEAATALARAPESLERIRRRAPGAVACADWSRVVAGFEALVTGGLAPSAGGEDDGGQTSSGGSR